MTNRDTGAANNLHCIAPYFIVDDIFRWLRNHMEEN
jgi:hypothetical protein